MGNTIVMDGVQILAVFIHEQMAEILPCNYLVTAGIFADFLLFDGHRAHAFKPVSDLVNLIGPETFSQHNKCLRGMSPLFIKLEREIMCEQEQHQILHALFLLRFHLLLRLISCWTGLKGDCQTVHVCLLSRANTIPSTSRA